MVAEVAVAVKLGMKKNTLWSSWSHTFEGTNTTLIAVLLKHVLLLPPEVLDIAQELLDIAQELLDIAQEVLDLAQEMPIS